MGLEALQQLRQHLGAAHKGPRQRQPQVDHRRDHRIKRLGGQVGGQVAVGFQVEAAAGVLQQVAVFHLGHRRAGGGGDAQLAKPVAVAVLQRLHLGEPQAPRLGGGAGGAHHRQIVGQQRQAGGVTMVVEPLGEQQQIQPLRCRPLAGQLAAEEPGAGWELQRAGEPRVHQHPQAPQLQQPAIGSGVGGVHGRVCGLADPTDCC